MTEEILAQLNSIDLTDVIQTLQEDQENLFILNNKYISRPAIEHEGYLISVVDYQAPGNKFGYDIFIQKFIGNDEYVKILSTGVQAEQRILNWQLIDKTLYGIDR